MDIIKHLNKGEQEILLKNS